MRVFSSASVDDSDEIDLSTVAWADSVAIVFGDADHQEQITLDFYDPAALDRLADLASQGAEKLRAKIAESESGVDDDRPVEPAAP